MSQINTLEHKLCRPPADAHDLLALNCAAQWCHIGPRDARAFIGRLPNDNRLHIWTTRCRCTSDTIAGCTLPKAITRAARICGPGEPIVTHFVEPVEPPVTQAHPLDRSAQIDQVIAERDEARRLHDKVAVQSSTEIKRLLVRLHSLEGLLRDAAKDRDAALDQLRQVRLALEDTK